MSNSIPKELFDHVFDQDRAPIGIGLKREEAINELMTAYSVDYRTASEAWNTAVYIDSRRKNQEL